MIFVDQSPTRYDLRFRVLWFPVRISPWFWLSVGLLGQRELELGFDRWLLWILAAFVSIMVHELGHAVLMRRFGSPARIELLAFCGVAIPTYVSPNPWRRLLIAVGGPVAGFAFAGYVWLSNRLFAWASVHPLFGHLGEELLFINVVWSMVNLIPIWPLDGGKILREVLVLARLRQPDYHTMRVSFGLALILTIYGFLLNFGPIHWRNDVLQTLPSWLWWVIPSPLMTFFMGMFAYQSYQQMQRLRGPRLYVNDDRVPWER